MDIIFSNGQFDGSTFSDRQYVRAFSDRQSNAIITFSDQQFDGLNCKQIKINKSWSEGIANDQTLAIHWFTYTKVMTFKSDHIIHTLIHVLNKYIIHVMSLKIKLVSIWWSKARLILLDDQKFSIAHVHENQQTLGKSSKSTTIQPLGHDQ